MYHFPVYNKHRKTLAASSRTRSAVHPLGNIESLLRALGSEILEGRGSRVRVDLNAAFGVPRPHHSPDDKGAVKSMRRFPRNAESSHEGLTYKAIRPVRIRPRRGYFSRRGHEPGFVITFQGQSIVDLKQAVADSVEDYLNFARSRAGSPKSRFRGVKRRLPPDAPAPRPEGERRWQEAATKWVVEALDQPTASNRAYHA